MKKEDKRNHRLLVADSGPGLERRQCNLQICISLERTGQRVSGDEIKAYHPGLDVYWQQNARVNTRFSLPGVDKKHTESRDVSENRKEFVPFCDNLSSQVSEEFHKATKNVNGIAWFGISVATDIRQPRLCYWKNFETYE